MLESYDYLNELSHLSIITKMGLHKLLSGFIIVFIHMHIAGANWSTSGEWSACTVTCGHGIRSRVRTCNGDDCSGPSEMHMLCKVDDCNGSEAPVWSSWGAWTSCSRTCGGGTSIRERTCSSGHVVDCCNHSDDASCKREYWQTRECVNEDCFGSWGEWRPWEMCSAQCGDGIQTRQRQCEPHNAVCQGAQQQSRTCYVQCATSDSLLDGAENKSSCSEGTPCAHGGHCEVQDDHVTCQCVGNWRGRYCSSMCLIPSDNDSCSDKHGIFHDCGDCSKFIVCARGHLISMPCVPGRIWSGDGCKPPSETTCTTQ